MAKIFVPEVFEESAEFLKNSEEYLKRNPVDYLWVTNPAEPYTSWECMSLCGNGEILLGDYRFFFGKMQSEQEGVVTFAGGFFCEGKALNCSGFLLDTRTKNGIIRFEVSSCGEIFHELHACIRYLMPLEEAADGEGDVFAPRLLSVLSNTPFTYTGKKAFHAQLSFCEILNPEVSCILLPEEELGTNMLTVNGAEARCMPVNGARLVFERTASSYSREQDVIAFEGWDYYLSVHGDFQCEDFGMVMGLHGGEYFDVKGPLRFTAGQDAFLSAKDVSCESECRPTTAWLSVCGDYHSSPSGSPFYRMAKGSLRLYEPTAATYREYSPAFPYMPWKGSLADSAKEGTAGESLLYKGRYQRLFESKPDTACKMAGEELAVTANGLCIGVDSVTGIWNWVGIANLAGGGLPDIRLSPVSEAGRKAFLDKDCFVCAYTVEEFRALGQTAPIFVEAAGWKIGLSPEDWQEGAAFLMKYTTDFSIREHLAGVKPFEELLRKAYDGKGEVREGFEDFIRIVEDRRFQGTVLLNAMARLKEVSPEAGMILNSVEWIPAFYTVVESGRIETAEGKIRVEQSTVSAFLHYEAKAESVSGEGSFKTTGVSVTIKNSELADFRSKSELRIHKLLGEDVGNCCMVINGVSERLSGRESYRFMLESGADCTPAESMLEQISVKEVQMLPEYGMSGAFALSGGMRFLKCRNADLFSCEALFYENLLLALDDRGKVTEEASFLRLVSARAEMRENSLAERFGMHAEAMLCNQTGTPDDLGYRSVNTPERQEALDGHYSALLWSLHAGGSGKLGGDAPVSLNLITAWSGKKFYIGVRESDLTGLSLSGVLGVGFGGMEIIQQSDTSDGRLMIKLCNIGVHFLKFTFPYKSADLYLFGEHGKIGWYMGYGEVKD